MRPARGTALRTHVVPIRFGTGCAPGPKADAKLAPRIQEIRKLLRTDLSLNEIADELGCCRISLRNLIRRRRLCDVKERAHFISLQKSLAREEKRYKRPSPQPSPNDGDDDQRDRRDRGAASDPVHPKYPVTSEA